MCDSHLVVCVRGIIMRIMMSLVFNFYNLASIHHLIICVASFPHLQNVHMHGSEFLYRCAHSPVKFVFIDANWRPLVTL